MMNQLILSLFFSLSIFATTTTRPNLIFILADDLGWADIGITSHGQILTPNIDALFNSSINLSNYYVQPVCTPTRASIMTGRYPIRYGLQELVICNACPYGLNLNETTLTEILHDNQYKTHAIGKWHLGYVQWEYTPTYRGFDSFYGFYNGGETYFSHMTLGGYDLRFDNGTNCGQNCTEILYGQNGTYSTHLYTNRAIEIIENHSKSDQPFYIYLSYQAPHNPSEVPDKYIHMYDDLIHDEERRRFAGIVSCMDEGIGNMTRTLKEKGLYDDTIIIFSSDNGGPIHEDGCIPCAFPIGQKNTPYRAGKDSLYEGGVKGLSFIKDINPQYYSYGGLMHSTDWLPTIIDMLNLNNSLYIHNNNYINIRTNKNNNFENKSPLDGYSHWNNIINKNSTSPRQNILFNIEMMHIGGPRASYRDNKYKLIVGPAGPPYSTPPIPNNDKIPDEIIVILKEMNFPEDSPIELYDLDVDPSEEHNIFGSKKENGDEISLRLIKEIQKYYNEMFPGYNPYNDDPDATKAFVNGTWMPWR